jgi:hypothetical protein
MKCHEDENANLVNRFPEHYEVDPHTHETPVGSPQRQRLPIIAVRTKF